MDLTGAGNPTTGPHYIDVVYAPPTGTMLDYSTIYSATGPTLTIGSLSITLGAPTAIEMVADPTSGALVATAVSQTQAQTDNVTRFRYDFSGRRAGWTPGTATITIPTWKDSGGDDAASTTLTFQVQGPTVQLVQPTNGSGIDINAINGRTYVDVTLSVPSYAPAGSTIDWAAITSDDADRLAHRPGRRLGHDRHEPGRCDPAGRHRRAAPCATRSPARSPRPATSTSPTSPAARRSSGSRRVTGGTIPVEVDQGAQTIDVPFPVGTLGPTGFQIDPASLGDLNQFTLSGPGLGTVHDRPVLHAAGRRRTASPSATRSPASSRDRRRGQRDLRHRDVEGDGDERHAELRHDRRDVRRPGGARHGHGVAIPTFEQEGQALEITFAVPDGATIDASSIAAYTGVVLGGAGLGTVAFDHDYAPQLLSDGKTVAYRIKGAFASGDVTATVTQGAFSYVDPIAALDREHDLDAGAGRPPQLDRRRAHPDERWDDRLPAPRPRQHRPRHHRPDDRVRRRHRTVDSQTPIWLGGNKFRFFLDGAFVPGEVDLSFAAGSFSDSNGYHNAAASFTVHRARPDRRACRPGLELDRRCERDQRRGLHRHPVHRSRRLDARPDDDRERLDGVHALRRDRLRHRHAKAPVLVSHVDGNTWVYRYWTTGSYTSGTVEVTFVSGLRLHPGARSSARSRRQLHRRRRRDAEHPSRRRPADADGRQHDRRVVDHRHRSGVRALRRRARPASRSSRRGADAAPGHHDLPLLRRAARSRRARSTSTSSPARSAPAGSRTSARATASRSSSSPLRSRARAPAAMTGVQTINGQSFVDVTYTLPLRDRARRDLGHRPDGRVRDRAGQLERRHDRARRRAGAGPHLEHRDELHVPLLDDRDDAERQRPAHVHRRQRHVHRRAQRTIPLFAPEQVTVQGSTGNLYIVVPYGTTTSLDASSINGDEFTVSGGARRRARPRSAGRRARTSTRSPARASRPASTTLTFAAGQWTYGGQGSVLRRPRRSRSSATRTSTSSTHRPRPCRSTSARSPTATELTLAGRRRRHRAPRLGQAPTILGNGLVRYYVTGQFAPGTVSVVVHRRLVAGHAGRPGSRRLRRRSS